MAQEATDSRCGVDPRTGRFSIDQWRDEVAARCIRVGWDVPQVCVMEGYRLFTLSKLLFEAEFKLGIRQLPEDAYGHRVILEGGNSLDTLRLQAEGMVGESEYDQAHVASRRAERQREYESVRQQNDLAAANQEQSIGYASEFTSRNYGR
jgi:hypothetical protein